MISVISQDIFDFKKNKAKPTMEIKISCPGLNKEYLQKFIEDLSEGHLQEGPMIKTVDFIRHAFLGPVPTSLFFIIDENTILKVIVEDKKITWTDPYLKPVLPTPTQKVTLKIL